MPKTAASCCSSSSGNGASEPRATVCNDTVVSAPARAPTEIQPAILSLWLMSKNPVLFRGVENIHLQHCSDANVTPGFRAAPKRLAEKVPRFTRSLRRSRAVRASPSRWRSGLALAGHGGGGLGRRLGVAQVIVAQRPAGRHRVRRPAECRWGCSGRRCRCPEIWSRYFTSARIELPWAATSTWRPARIAGAMDSFQNGSTRATMSFRHSVSGTSPGASLA